jgi:hypothetical protein
MKRLQFLRIELNMAGFVSELLLTRKQSDNAAIFHDVRCYKVKKCLKNGFDGIA